MKTLFTFPKVKAMSPFAVESFSRNLMGLIVAMAFAANGSAQQVVMPTPQEPLVAPVLRPTEAEAAASPSTFQAFPNGRSLSDGQFHLRPHLVASAVHADGLPVGAARVTSDIYTFAPGLLVDLGPHWTFDYTATSNNYSAAELHDAVDQYFRLVGGNRSPDWRIQLSDSYSISSPILTETAQQNKQKSWQNSVSVDHDFGNLLVYQGTFGMNDLKTENFTETRDWQTEQNVNAKVSSRTIAGLGFGLGYSDIVAHPNSRYEKYLANLKWRPTDRIDLSLQGGWQNWHSLAAAGGDERNPVLQARLGWQPFDQTRIALENTRVTANSLTGDSVTDSDNWTVSLNQRLLGKLLLNLAYNHVTSDYRSTTGTLPTVRSDRVEAFSSVLSVQLFKYWTLAATYHTAKNHSDLTIFNYTSTQYGLELTGRY